MQTKKKELEIFFNALKGTEGILSLADSRVRDSFLKPLGEALESFYKERTAIYEEFCTKTEDGKPDIADGKYHFPQEKLEEVNKELLTLVEEEVELTTPERLKEILNKTEYKPRMGEVEIIDGLIERL